MIHCPNCNAPLTPDSRFCNSCGKQLSAGDPTRPATTTPPSSGMAIGAFVCSLLPCMSIVGLVLGLISLSRIRARPSENGGKGLAIAAVVISSIFLVIGAVGVLAAIAIPNFMKFQARSKQSEAKVELKALYLSSKDASTDPNWAAAKLSAMEPKRRYAYFVGDQVKQPEGHEYEIPSDLLDRVQQNDVIAVAVTNLDADEALDVWVIDDQGKLTHLRDDVTE